jgi:predicted nucleotidyltransferase
MSQFGLIDSDIEYLKSVFSSFNSIEQVIIFGSRAKGNYKNGSDVDIALKGKNITFNDILQIDNELNEKSNLPYKFDVVHYENIQTPALKEHIDRVGIPFV